MCGICCACKSDVVHPTTTKETTDVKPTSLSPNDDENDKADMHKPTEQIATTDQVDDPLVAPADGTELPDTVPVSCPVPPTSLSRPGEGDIDNMAISSHIDDEDEEEAEEEEEDDVIEEEDEVDIRPSYYSSDDFGMPVYTEASTSLRVCLFYPYHDRLAFIDRTKLILERVKINRLYSLDNDGKLSTITADRLSVYLDRPSVVCGNLAAYRTLVLPSLLLGCRVRDYDQRAATVVQTGPLVLSMPAQNRRLSTLRLMTSEGVVFDAAVSSVQRAPKRWLVTCKNTRLPSSVRIGVAMDLLGAPSQQPRVTAALLQGDVAEINSWPLLRCIYGVGDDRHYPAISPRDVSVQLKRGGEVWLNPEQAEAIARYNSDASFVIEAPPGSGKTLTAAAMAVNYEREGLQLFLSTANVPVANMALALAKLDYGSIRAIHLVSSEREEQMNEETRSPFSVLSLAMSTNKLRESLVRLEYEMAYASGQEKRRLRAKLQAVCGPVLSRQYDVIFATVDMLLGYLHKLPRRGRRRREPDESITQQLQRVQKVVVDEASQLTEAALNALILSFPRAQLVLIGDSRQLPPFKYERGEIVSELAARSSLDVVKAKTNLPVIKLKRVYRAAPPLIAHYSNVFYSGALISHKSESPNNPLASFGDSRCLFFNVSGIAKQSGSSKINDEEIACLVHVLNTLRQSGHDQHSVMIISYYEAQRRLVETSLPQGYELLTVDSAQGREKQIVVVLTTRTSVPTEEGAFFNCPLRCNVAMSRHQEALIVIGHPSVAAAPNWSNVLSDKYFKHMSWKSS